MSKLLLEKSINKHYGAITFFTIDHQLSTTNSPDVIHLGLEQALLGRVSFDELLTKDETPTSSDTLTPGTSIGSGSTSPAEAVAISFKTTSGAPDEQSADPTTAEDTDGFTCCGIEG